MMPIRFDSLGHLPAGSYGALAALAAVGIMLVGLVF